MPSWIWLIIIVVIMLVVWWALVRSAETYEKDIDVQQDEGEIVLVEEEVEIVIEPDDLTRIEGIGPKINSLLQAASITTFAELAQADVNILSEILQANALDFHNPKSWPEQAHLAAEGKWEELQILQEQLSGGREI